jgi:NADH-quinone oxidoreductase subunit M
MLTAILIGLPLVAALLLLFASGDGAKRIAFFAALAELGVAIFAFWFMRTAPHDEVYAHRMVMDVPWITSIGVNFNVALDGISMVLVLLTAFLVPVIILSGFEKKYDNPSLFYTFVLFMQMALVGVFVARDGFLFYVFWELALIPIYFICLLWGGENRGRITFKFFVYTLAGSLFMLAALIWLYLNTPLNDADTHTFNIQALYTAGQGMELDEQAFVFWSFFLAFAIKMPVFPFHTWQPDTYVNAPTQGTMLLSGIMLKMGTYGLLRWTLPMTPLAFEKYAPIVIVLSVISVVYASAMAIVQKDFKRLIAYSSIAHVGLIAAGILSFNVTGGGTEGLTGSIIQMFAHGVNVVGLFFIADILLKKTGTNEIGQMGGIRNVSPQFAALFLIVLLGSVALPLTNGFVGEFLLLNGIAQYSFWACAIAGTTVILGAVYMLRSYQVIMLGETNKVTSGFAALTTNEKAVLFIVCAAVLAFGVYPKPLLDIMQADVNALASEIIGAVKP